MASTNLDAYDIDQQGYGGLAHEDVLDQIFDISSVPLPLTDIIESDSVRNKYTSWVEDALATPSIDNAQVDGADITTNNTQLGDRVGNHLQTSTKLCKVSTRAQDTDSIGISDALSYQISQRNKDLRRDVEAGSLSGNASVSGTDAVAGQSAGLAAWIVTNADRGATGAGTGFDTATGLVAPVAEGTKRALSMATLDTVIQGVYEEGGDPSVLMMLPGQCSKFSDYLFGATTVAQIQTNVSQGETEGSTAVGAVNVYLSDFGRFSIVPNRIQQPTGTGADAGDIFVIDPSLIRHGFLTGYSMKELSVNGLYDSRLLLVDWTLKVLNEKGLGLVADVDFAAAVVD